MNSPAFRRRRALDVASLHFGPNMTPMVDVVMVILVFFMVSAAFLGPEWLLGSLVPRPAPTAGAGSTAKGPGQGPKDSDPLATAPVRFTIDLKKAPSPPGEPAPTSAQALATGAGLTDAPIEQVVEALKTKVGDRSLSTVEVLIRPGDGVPWGAVVRTHELCTKAGFVRVGPKTGK
ncbi:MAG TPA: biopolymer transporter ExbD [Phycisphaerales bacterium]|nr:biopolymer transporter ExbD [Phycisphaerales bacterium]